MWGPSRVNDAAEMFGPARRRQPGQTRKQTGERRTENRIEKAAPPRPRALPGDALSGRLRLPDAPRPITCVGSVPRGRASQTVRRRAEPGDEGSSPGTARRRGQGCLTGPKRGHTKTKPGEVA